MKIAIAPDSFKECLTADEVAGAIEEGVRRALPDCVTVCVPMADGGEGTVDALIAATNGRIVELTGTGPMGTPVATRYGLLGDGESAVIEMAAVSGLPLVRTEERDPRIATTYGTGELLCDALNRGASRIIIGLGGSATNDGGAGAAQALGVSLRDAAGRELPWGGPPWRGWQRLTFRDGIPGSTSACSRPPATSTTRSAVQPARAVSTALRKAPGRQWLRNSTPRCGISET